MQNSAKNIRNSNTPLHEGQEECRGGEKIQTAVRARASGAAHQSECAGEVFRVFSMATVVLSK